MPRPPAFGWNPSAEGRGMRCPVPNTISAVPLLAAGIILICGQSWGLYALVVPLLAAFAGGLTNAWLFMVRLHE